MMRNKRIENKNASWRDRRNGAETITKPLFNGAICSPSLDHAQNSRATLVPRGVIMRLSSGRRAPRLLFLLHARGGRASSDFFDVTARLQLRSTSARDGLQKIGPPFDATRRVKQPHLRA